MKIDIKEFIQNNYFEDKSKPLFEHFLKPELVSLNEGEAVITMYIENQHLNIGRMIHGGILASVVDIAMGVACISYQKSVVTSEMNITYIRNIDSGNTIKAVAKVINNGKTLMRTICSIYDEDDRLLTSATATYFVLGKLNINE